MDGLLELYRKAIGGPDPDVERMAGAGSNRAYYRLKTPAGSMVGVVGTSIEENEAFIFLTHHFTGAGLNVPHIIAVSDDHSRYLQTDLGTTSLYDAVAQGRGKGGDYSDEEVALLAAAVRYLPKLQFEGAQGLDFSHCYPQPCFDEDNVLFDLNYFKYCFLLPSGVAFHEGRLQADFKAMARDLTVEEGNAFMYRDFQARNIMLRDGEAGPEPFFIDYQGGRKGPYYHDLASFAWQASARYSSALRRHLADIYYNELGKYITAPSRQYFDSRLILFVLFRTLQVLGAYGFRGYVERKDYFIRSIPHAISNLTTLITACDGYPYLQSVLSRLVDAKGGKAPGLPRTHEHGRLKVRVYSFSYRKGAPVDESGNGGGYVFDCRGSNNPGRYDEYKALTGRDEPVVRFLEDDGEVVTFLERIYPIADTHVERYLQRGFTSLMFSFGCTGGRHRSVYCADRLAKHIHSMFDVEVVVSHCGLGISYVLDAQPAVAQAMVLAAGLGTRLRPLTDSRPKALVEVGGRTLLELAVRHVAARRTVVNIHHFASMVKAYLQEHRNFGFDIVLSDESEALLDTGGALKKAAALFDPTMPVLIHNVDIISNADLPALYREGYHHDAVLLVSSRETSRYLLFDDDMRLVGWKNVLTGEMRGREGKPYAFSGIHVLHPRLFGSMEAFGDRFSIIDFYLSVCDKADVRGFADSKLRLLDVGKIDSLKYAKDYNP